MRSRTKNCCAGPKHKGSLNTAWQATEPLVY